MIEDLVGAYGTRLVIAVLGVGVGLVCLIGILWLMRGRSGPSPFVRGGRNRNPRLQVLDAAAVDTRRRLVLVRRDNVEHLIMIGGPTDIVIESGIGQGAPQVVAIGEPAVAITETGERPLPRPAAEPRPETFRDLPAPPLRPVVSPVSQSSVTAAAASPAISAGLTGRNEPAPGQPMRATSSRIEPAARTTMEIPRQTPAATALPTPAQTSAAIAPAVAAPAANRAAAAAPTPAPAVDDAANALEAARGRVLPERSEQLPRVVAIGSAAWSPVQPPASERPKVLGSDFEKILEEEMAQNLAARDEATLRPNRQAPPRDPAAATIAAPASDPSLQDEVARIFGEMSATRDK